MTEQNKFKWLDSLNPEQRQAVTHGDGPLLIVAGAGSGKTRTLAYRVAWLIAGGVDPSGILLLTFTRRAAEEMLKRAASIVSEGAAVTGKTWGGTFHSVGNRLLRMYADSAGLENDFTVLDRSDSEDMLNVIRHDLKLHSREKRFPRKSACMSIYSRCVNGASDLDQVLKRYFPWCVDWKDELKALFREYVVRKQDRNVLDYDDLLLYWAGLVSDPAIATRMGERFTHVLVDEYQDTNRVQFDILKGMRATNRNLTAVGDDAQSIYGFRAATVKNMFEFPEHFKGATIVTLDRNYRSVMPILETTNRVIAQASERYSKTLRTDRKTGEKPRLVMCKDEAGQDEYVIDRVLEHYEQGIPLRRQAVLFRAAHLSDSLEVELSRRNIPFHKYGGLRFLEAAHVKDLVAFLRVLENPRDDMAWFRILLLLDGIGPVFAGRIVNHVLTSGNDPGAVETFPSSAAVRDQLKSLAKVFRDTGLPGDETPAMQVERIRKFYDPFLRKAYDNPDMRARDLENLEQIAAGYKSRGKFLADLQLDPPASTEDFAGAPYVDEDWLVLSTIHSAKGCEWDVVYLIHAADGCLPSDMATGNPEEIEEELRLTYVALTRARDFLYVTWPLRYYHRWSRYTDKHSYAQLCRFFTPDVRETFENVDLDQVESDDNSVSEAKGTADSVAQRIRSMWE